MEARRGRRRRERTGTRQRRRARRREKRRGRGNDGDVTRGVPVLGLERHGRGGGASTAASSRFARVQRLSGKSAPRVRCERRARGPVTAPNAPSARPLRASPRVSSSARAALPRPQARPRVPRATRPPTRVTSKKRRDALKSPSARTNVSLGTVDKPKIASGFERERRFIGKCSPFCGKEKRVRSARTIDRFDQNRGAGGSPRGETHPARVQVYSQKSELKNVVCRRTLVETRVSVVRSAFETDRREISPPPRSWGRDRRPGPPRRRRRPCRPCRAPPRPRPGTSWR